LDELVPAEGQNAHVIGDEVGDEGIIRMKVLYVTVRRSFPLAHCE
jgi:hypothetical protein